MFTGIVEAIGQVKSLIKGAKSASLSVDVNFSDRSLNIGDSVAVNGVCLTATQVYDAGFIADVGFETLNVTSLGKLSSDSYVNIERAIKLGGRLDGHIVQGHVDDVGKILNINNIGDGVEVKVSAKEDVLKYVVKRGSITINGVSLTASDVSDAFFKVFLIPHTLEITTFKYLKIGDFINLEVDIIGKYVEKLLQSGGFKADPSKITEEFLKENGF